MKTVLLQKYEVFLFCVLIINLCYLSVFFQTLLIRMSYFLQRLCTSKKNEKKGRVRKLVGK